MRLTYPCRFAGTSCAALILIFATGAVATPPARTRLLASGLSEPVCIAAVPGDAEHVAVCERGGVIRIVATDSGTVAAGPLLDIHTLVSTLGDGGLLGLAFDPAFQTTGMFYVFYNSEPLGDRVLARYHAAPGTLVAEPESGATLWQYPRSIGHNGGWIGFSPINGYLYLSSGDGGTSWTFDGPNRAQTITDQLLGKILRIDVHGDDFPSDPNRNYRIPASNPFVGTTGDDEIWSYGVRNPWRCSFDRVTGDLYIADVGQDEREEVDFEPPTSPGGRNYGWRCMEGTFCTGLGGCDCQGPSLAGPLYEYDHTQGRSITGGYVYRGQAIPALQGLYFLSDFEENRIWSFRPSAGGAGVTELQDRTLELRPSLVSPPVSRISAFGEDGAGELYMCDFYSGRLYQVIPYPCPPVVDQQPVGGTFGPSQNVILSVVGAGAEPLTYQWRKGGVGLIDGGRVSGSTGDTLSILAAQVTDTGDYDVVLTDACGSTVSNAVRVQVVRCPGDFNGVGGVSVQDIFDFLSAYFGGDPRADVNESGSLSVQDIFDFLSAYFAGCA